MVNKSWKDRLNPGKFDSIEMISTFSSLKKPNNFPEAVTSIGFETGQWRETVGCILEQVASHYMYLLFSM